MFHADCREQNQSCCSGEAQAPFVGRLTRSLALTSCPSMSLAALRLHSVKRHQPALASDTADALQGSAKASSTRSNKIGEGCAGRSFLNSFSISEKSFIWAEARFSKPPARSGNVMPRCFAKCQVRRQSRQTSIRSKFS